MGHNGPYPGLYCQNDEVSTVCTRAVDGVGVQICAALDLSGHLYEVDLGSWIL